MLTRIPNQRKLDQICNSLKWADKGESGQNPGGSNSWEIGAEYQSGGALPVLPLLDWAAGKGLPGGGGESRITKFTGMVTFALQPPFTVFANNQILRTPSIVLGIFSTQKERNSIEVVNFNLVLSSVACAQGNSRLTS